MQHQTYLLRKAGRYHFRRRFSLDGGSDAPITVALGTADPLEARRLVRRLAVSWDDVTVKIDQTFERGTLTIEEQRSLVRQALEDELAHATRHLMVPGQRSPEAPMHRKVLIAAYTIAAGMKHDAAKLTKDQVDEQLDDTWTAPERHLLFKTLALYITPGIVNRTDAAAALERINAPINEGTLNEARQTLIGGRIEAQRRAGLVGHPLFVDRDVPAHYLLDDDLVEQARRVVVPPALNDMPRPTSEMTAQSSVASGNWLFAKTTRVRFSDQISALEEQLFSTHGWQPDNGKTRLMLETFAWLTNDKCMSDYEPQDIPEYVQRLARIPKGFVWGRLGESGGMAEPYDPFVFPAKMADIPVDQRRSLRTINSHLTKMQAASELLKKTFWLPKAGHGNVMDFQDERRKVEDDPADPKRMPWTPKHLEQMYGLPLWQGGGGTLHRVKESPRPAVYQDAAYWVPLIGTYTGLAREEACGLECVDFNFDCDIPFLIVQANMTRSKDGVTKAGLKRKSRYRVMPLHPELQRLGLERYARRIEADGHAMLFPELYKQKAKAGEGGKKAPAFGGRRFYATA